MTHNEEPALWIKDPLAILADRGLTLDKPCRTVFASGQHRVEAIGPLLEDVL
jgi:hypothetical protein